MNPWWQVDLGKPRIVVALDIYSKCGMHHFRNIHTYHRLSLLQSTV